MARPASKPSPAASPPMRRAAILLLPLLLIGAAIGVIAHDSDPPDVYSWSGAGDTVTPAFDFPGGGAWLCFGLDQPDERVRPINVNVVDEATGQGAYWMITAGDGVLPARGGTNEEGTFDCATEPQGGLLYMTPGRYVVVVDVLDNLTWRVSLEPAPRRRPVIARP